MADIPFAATFIFLR